MDTDIICTLIEVGGTAATAIITALIAKWAIMEGIKPVFQSYSDKSYNLAKIIGKAKHNIVIMGSSGYSILEDYGSDIEEKLNNGVSVYYLFLDENHLPQMEKYRHDNGEIDANLYSEVKGKLEVWSSKYNQQLIRLHVREFSKFMTAAYVGVDIPFGEEREWHLPDSVIQVVLYQYGNKARNSPLRLLSYKRDRKHFMGTLESMSKMWDESKVPDYVNQVKNGKKSMVKE